MVVVYLDETGDCPLCGAENAYVLKGDDKVCEHCDYMPRESSRSVEGYATDDQWGEWWRRRRNNDDYSGWSGEDRIKMVGGFAKVYFEEDFAER